MINKLLDVTKSLKELSKNKFELNADGIKEFFDKQILGCYKSLLLIHNSYLLSLNDYKASVFNSHKVDLETFNNLIFKVNVNMSTVFDKPCSLRILNILHEISNVSNNKNLVFYEKCKGFIEDVNNYLSKNQRNKISTYIYLPPWPLEIDVNVTDLSQIDFDKIYPKDCCYRTSRKELIDSMMTDFEDCMKMKDPENLNESLISQVIKIVDDSVSDLNERYFMVNTQFEELKLYINQL